MKKLLLFPIIIIILLTGCNNKTIIKPINTSTPIPIDNSFTIIYKLLNMDSQDIKEKYHLPPTVTINGEIRYINSNIPCFTPNTTISSPSFRTTLGISIIYNTYNLHPEYLRITGDTNISNININGAKPGMSLKEIQSILKNTKLQTVYTENYKQYNLYYHEKGFIYIFSAYDTVNSELFIKKE